MKFTLLYVTVSLNVHGGIGLMAWPILMAGIQRDLRKRICLAATRTTNRLNETVIIIYLRYDLQLLFHLRRYKISNFSNITADTEYGASRVSKVKRSIISTKCSFQ